MIAILVCDSDKQELAMISQDCKKQVERNSNEALQIETAANGQDFSRAAEDEKLIDLLYYEFRKGQEISSLCSFRRRCSNTIGGRQR